MDSQFAEILKNTYTTVQFNHRLKVLKFFLTAKVFGGKSPDVPPEDLSWFNSLSKDFVSNFDADNLSTSLQSLEETFSQSPILTINISFNPDEGTISQIGEYIRQNFTTFTLLDIKYAPSIIAGAALVWKGVYKDYSLKMAIEGKKDQVLEGFKRFL